MNGTFGPRIAYGTAAKDNLSKARQAVHNQNRQPNPWRLPVLYERIVCNGNTTRVTRPSERFCLTL